jgi:hypothetical protein
MIGAVVAVCEFSLLLGSRAGWPGKANLRECLVKIKSTSFRRVLFKKHFHSMEISPGNMAIAG